MASSDRIRAPAAAWKRLGALLQFRRRQLGYKFRPAFAEARLPPTRYGNVNVRFVADIEEGYRPDSYPTGTLMQVADAYQVTYESLTAVLGGTAAALTPVSPAPAVPLAAGPGAAPMTDPERAAAAAPYANRIWQHLLVLARQGITDPDGGQVFPRDDGDAKAWDGTAGRMDLPDRVWMIADMQRRAASRGGGHSRTGVNGA